MEQDATQLIQKRLAELPEDVRNAIQANDLDERIRAIGAKNSLHIDRVGELETQVYFAMLGLTDFEDFPKVLEDTLSLEPGVAQKVAADVGQEIFESIRESMKKFVEERVPRPAAETVPAATEVAVSAPAPIVTPPAPPIPPADVMLSQKTVSVPTPQQTMKGTEPQPYKADPYREPV